MNEPTRYAIVSTGGLVVGVCFWGRTAEPAVAGFKVIEASLAEIGWHFKDPGFCAPEGTN